MKVEMIERLAKTIAPLSVLEPEEDIPDYLGEAVHRAGEACYDVLETNDAVLFERLYKPYFFGALIVFERLKQQLGDRHAFASLPWLAQPVIDVLTLSGYALIYAELHQDPGLWRAVRSTWDSYLASADGQAATKVLGALVSYQETSFAIPPRDMVRSWDARLNHTLAALPRTPAAGTMGLGSVQHTSPLIVEISGSLMGVRSKIGLDVFLARYLMPHVAAAGADFGINDWRIRDLRNLPPLMAEQ